MLNHIFGVTFITHNFIEVYAKILYKNGERVHFPFLLNNFALQQSQLHCKLQTK